MTGRALTARIDAVQCRREGRRPSVKVAPPYREFARRHQDLLRQAFRYPNTEVDLTEGLSIEDMKLLGFERMDHGAWTSPLGDDDRDRLLLMNRDQALAIAAERRRRMQREQRGLERQVA
jgi:hypothetical protein